MKIINYRVFIKETYSDLITKFNLNIVEKNNYIIELKNSNTVIEFFTEYRVDNKIGIVLTNKGLKKYIDVLSIPSLNGASDPFSFMSNEENTKANSFNDPIKEFIYISFLILKQNESFLK